ncbi:MAG: hypothetical protein KKF48_01745 [Nanoarchaeota archaeon]|nr:hypothetical protein [Nanoarchaeota archaeon]MBU1027744.1 hypothetical protein [Nanoarchaeota archaeon]
MELKELGKKVMEISLISTLGLASAILCRTLQSLNEFSLNRINSEKELQMILKERAEKIGLDYSKISISFRKRYGSTTRNVPNGYYIEINRGCPVKDLDHELYHIFKKDPDKKQKSLLNYLLIEEPRATLYETFGVKI